MKYKLRYRIYFLLLSIIWGSSFYLIKLSIFGKDHKILFNALQISSLRFLFAGIILLPFSIKYINLLFNVKTLFYLSIIGLTSYFIPSLLFSQSMGEVSLVYAGVLSSLTPFFTLLICYFFLNTTINFLQIVSILLGILGIYLLLLSKNNFHYIFDNNPNSRLYLFYIVLATFLQAIGVILTKYKTPNLKPIQIVSLSMLIILIPSFIYLINSNINNVFEKDNGSIQCLFSIFFLGVINTALCAILYNLLIKNTNVVFASSVSYLIPIITILIGFVLGEILNRYEIISIIIILVSVYLLSFKGKVKL